MYWNFIDSSEKICGNCRYWDTAHTQSITIKDKDTPFGLKSYRLAPCERNPIEMDAGEDGIPMLGERSHCLNHPRAAFAPSKYFLQELEERRERDDYGVVPGRDHPATLFSPSKNTLYEFYFL